MLPGSHHKRSLPVCCGYKIREGAEKPEGREHKEKSMQ